MDETKHDEDIRRTKMKCNGRRNKHLVLVPCVRAMLIQTAIPKILSACSEEPEEEPEYVD